MGIRQRRDPGRALSGARGSRRVSGWRLSARPDLRGARERDVSRSIDCRRGGNAADSHARRAPLRGHVDRRRCRSTQRPTSWPSRGPIPSVIERDPESDDDLVRTCDETDPRSLHRRDVARSRAVQAPGPAWWSSRASLRSRRRATESSSLLRAMDSSARCREDRAPRDSPGTRCRVRGRSRPRSGFSPSVPRAVPMIRRAAHF